MQRIRRRRSDEPNPFKQKQETYAWFISICMRKESKLIVEIEGKKMIGSAIMWGDKGVMLFTPHNKRIIYTDSSVRKDVIEYIKDKRFRKKYFHFIDNFMSSDAIEMAKDYFKTMSLSKYRERDKPFYAYNVKIIKGCFDEYEKNRKMGKHKHCLSWAKSAKAKVKELEVCQESVQYEIKSLILMTEAYIKLNRYYQIIKSFRKTIKSNELLLVSHPFITYQSNIDVIKQHHSNNKILLSLLHKQITACLKLENLRYDLNENKIYHSHHIYPFEARGYKSLKTSTKYRTLKQKLRRCRQLRCGNCNKLSLKPKYKKCKCKNIYYCSKLCQKLDWKFSHKYKCVKYVCH